MKNKKAIVVSAIVLISCAFSSLQAQDKSHIEVLQTLPADSRFEDVKASMQKHFTRFNSEQERNKNGYKQWKRWEWFAERHLDADGRVSAWTRNAAEAIDEATSMALAPSGPEVQSVNGSWFSVGPGSVSNGQNFLGRTESVAFHPTDANTLYVGTATGGLWRTTNLGASWTPLTDNLPSLSVASVVVQQNNANIIYILTGDGDGGVQWGYYVKERSSGVFRSTDGGATWQATGLNWNRSDADRYGYKLIQSPTNTNLLLAATSDGLWRTTNAGATWTRVITGNVNDVVFKPDNANNVAAITFNSSILRTSSNGGATFTNRTIPASTTGVGTTRSMLAVTPAATNNVYVMMGAQGDSTIRGYYRFQWSNNGFNLITNTPNIFGSAGNGDGTSGFPWWAIAVAVSPTNSNIHVAGGVIGRRSTNGGVDWSSAHPAAMHVDLHGYTYSPTDGSLYCLHDGGISRSTNNGVAWTNLSTNLRITQYYRISASTGNVQAVLGGTQDNGHHYRTTNTSTFKWSLTCCDGMDNAIHPTNDQIIYMCSQNGGLNRSTNGGDTWTNISPGASSWVAPIALHTTTPTTIFFAGNAGIFRSTNSGTSGWVNIGADGRGAIAQGTSNSSRFYACGNNTTLRRSDNINDADPDWTTISGNTGWPPASELTGTQITAIAVNPANSTDVWITFSGYQEDTKVYRSTNSGANWTRMTGALPNVPIHTIKVRDLGNSNWEAYIGTDIGVFMRTNTFGWTYYSNALPRVIVTDIEINDTYIYAGTYGRGIWRSDLYSACPTNATYSATYNSERIFQASGTINATTTIVGTVGANVWMKAGTAVQLNPGFVAQSGTIFRASIGPCGATLLPVIPTEAKKEEEEEEVPK